MVRIARIGRMYKLVKLTRLLRVLKVVKQRGKLLKYVQDFLNIGIGFERLVYFVLTFIIGLHIISCLWIIIGNLEYGADDTWMDKFRTHDQAPYDQYVISFYWAATTITTVGYGDLSGVNNLERIFCIAVMIVGVICFTFASGSLASILQNYDN